MATPLKWGAEFLVNTTTNGQQIYPSIAALDNGRFVVSWTDWGLNPGDTSSQAVRAQVFNADGTPRGAEFLVNTATYSFQSGPTISALAGGRFVVAFQDSSGTGGDSDSKSIQAQMYNADGTRSGGEFLLNTTTAGSQFDPYSATLSNGRFVVAWTDDSQTGDTSGYGIRAQVFNANGTKSGAEFQVNSTTAEWQQDAQIAALNDGRFVITWMDSSATGDDTAGAAVRAQIYNADGSRSGDEFLVNTTTSGDQSGSSITALANGGFVISWADTSQSADDSSSGAVRAQVYGATGDRVGEEFLVNTKTLDTQFSPSTAALADGRFVVVWTDSTGDASGSAVHAQLFHANGSKSGTEFTVNTITSGTQGAATVTTLADGRFVVSWTDFSATGGDISYGAIRSQIFDPREAAVNLAGTATGDDLVGTSFGDLIHGGLGNDQLAGSGGRDRLFGDAGNDVLRGGDGSDRLTGGSGADKLVGGNGTDVFVFAAGSGGDRVADFSDGSDRIDLSAFAFASVAAAKGHFAAQGSDLIFTFGPATLLIENFTLAQLTSGDLIL